jgi:6-phosphogluconolactonase
MRSATGALIHVYSNLDSLAESAARDLVSRVEQTVAERGEFNLAISGGRTPEPLYRLLGSELFQRAAPWEAVSVFFVDERAVPPDHPDSNYRLAWQAWLKDSPIPLERIFRMEGEAADLHAAAERYGMLLTHQVPSGPTGFPSLDLALLGMGDDGHTASLFPKTAALNETLRVVAANEVPQHETWRLTLTYPTLDASREVWFLVAGAGKAHRVAQALGYAPGGEDLPCTLVRPLGGNLHWWLDRPAASELPQDAG